MWLPSSHRFQTSVVAASRSFPVSPDAAATTPEIARQVIAVTESWLCRKEMWSAGVKLFLRVGLLVGGVEDFFPAFLRVPESPVGASGVDQQKRLAAGRLGRRCYRIESAHVDAFRSAVRKDPGRSVELLDLRGQIQREPTLAREGPL